KAYADELEVAKAAFDGERFGDAFHKLSQLLEQAQVRSSVDAGSSSAREWVNRIRLMRAATLYNLGDVAGGREAARGLSTAQLPPSAWPALARLRAALAELDEARAILRELESATVD